MKPILLLGTAILLTCGLTGCSLIARFFMPKTDETAGQSVLVGRVGSIPPQRNYILIQSYGPWRVAAGTILLTRGPDGRSANLRVTGEALGQFAAADIQSGTLDVGDAVYTVPKTQTPNSTTTPETTHKLSQPP